MADMHGAEPADGRLRFLSALRQLHVAAGKPSARSISRQLGDVSHTTVAGLLNGRRIASWGITRRVVEVLGGREAEFYGLWAQAVAWPGAALPTASGSLTSTAISGLVTAPSSAVPGILLSQLLRLHCTLMDVANSKLWCVTDLESKVTALQLGVHRAPVLGRAEGGKDAAQHLPPYVGRDIDGLLDVAINGGGLVLITGDSMAGKSRTAFEALRRMPGHTRLLVPAARESLRTLVEHGVTLRDTVVWLNDLESYLGPRGLDVGVLYTLTGPGTQGVIALATMRDNEYRKWRAGPEHDSKAERELLQQATVIGLRRNYSAAENARAEALASDPRIKAAWDHRGAFGIAEYLGAGPELLVRWTHGRGTSNDGAVQVGSAIISAAIDCRRAGLARPVPDHLLRSLYAGYLRKVSGPLLDDALFDAGLAFATAPVERTTVACLDKANGGYRVSDYLLDEVQKDEAWPPVPDATWTAVLAEIEPAEAWEVGREAYWASRASFAENAFRIGLRSADLEVISQCALGMADLAYLLDQFPVAQRWRDRAANPQSLSAEPDLLSKLSQPLVLSSAEEWYLRNAGIGVDPSDALFVEHEHAVLAFDGKDYRHTITRALRNDSAEAIDRYPFRIAVVRYPDDMARNDAQYVKHPLTIEGSQISAWYDSEPLGRQPMDWVVEQDRPSFKEMWLLFKNGNQEFPLLSGQSGSVTYQYTVSCRHWGPWSKRKVRLKTGRLSLEFSFPAWMQPDVFGADVTVAKDESPMSIARRQLGDRIVFTWQTLNPPLNAQYQFNWQLGNDPDRVSSW